MKTRHTIFYRILRPLVILYLIIRFGYRYKKAKNLPENYIVLSNHTTDYDMLFVAASFPQQMYFVGSEHIARWKKIYWILKYAFEPIPRYKGGMAASTVMEIIRKVKKGGNVCIFAEGVRSWDGVTSPILPSTAKLIRSAGCGLVTYKLIGGYFTSPMWGGASVRKGNVYGEPVRVLTKEQISEMTNDELYEVISKDLYEDAYARQIETPHPYRGKHLAEHMERLLFLCPSCRKLETLQSDGDTVQCRECGFYFRYDEYGMLSCNRFRTVKELSDWQKAQVQEDIKNEQVYTAQEATLYSVKQHKETFITKGELSLSTTALCCGSMEFRMNDITDLAMHGQHAIVFTVGKEYYELLPSKEANALRFLLFYHGCKKNQNTKEK